MGVQRPSTFAFAARVRPCASSGLTAIDPLLMAAALFVPGLAAPLLPAIVRATLVAAGLFYFPGTVLARALDENDAQRADALANAFVLSLAMLVPAAAMTFALGAGSAFAAAMLLLVTSTAAVVRMRGHAHAGTVPFAQEREGRTQSGTGGRVEERGATWLRAVVLVLACAITAGALVWTERGSIDRWWYLGYVRAWSEGPFTAAEPFLASGFVHPRFAFNAWLAALAVWARLAHVDPVWLFDRAAPLLLVPAAFAAQLGFGRALFGSNRGALLTALCAGLLWAGGGPVAVLARVPEDKVMASVVMAPVLWSAVLRALDGGRRTRVWVVAAAALALCTVHPLAFVLAAGAAAAYAAWSAWRLPAVRARAAVLVAALVVASVYPVASGALAREEYVGQGAADLTADHPVARVHRAQERLIDTRDAGYVVDPRLLTHPVAVIGVLALLLLPWRSARERRFLVVSAALPLAIAFVPPLATTAGKAILPWMVYRVLWTLPFAALAAIAVDEAARRLGGRTALVVAILAAASAPPAARGMVRHESAERLAVAMPGDPSLHAAIEAVRALPADAIVAAAPELSERLPALTGRHVLAMSDRATITFSRSRDAGEARLRSRAALFGGLWKPAADAPAPTHVLYAPPSAASSYCAEQLFANESFVLCSFRATPPAPGIRLPEASVDSDGVQRVAVADALGAGTETLHATCNGARVSGGDVLAWRRPGPWSAAFNAASCDLRATDGARFSPRTVVLSPVLASAVEELTIQITGERDGALRWRVRTRARAHDHEILRFGLPRGAITAMRVEIIPSFLPFVRLATLDVTFEDEQSAH